MVVVMLLFMIATAGHVTNHRMCVLFYSHCCFILFGVIFTNK